MMISKYNNSKIKILNTVLIMMVLYIHSFYIEGTNYEIAYAIQRFLGTSGIMSVATQLFFSISGFLFFYNIETIKECFPKIKKRIRTLIVPYLIWNIIFVLWYIALEEIPFASKFINGSIQDNFNNFIDSVYFLFIKPANFPLWFLRDLIVFVFCSPIIFLFIKSLRWWSILITIIITYFLPFVGLYYFVLGGCIAMLSSLDGIENILNKWVVGVCALIYLGMSVYIVTRPAVSLFIHTYLQLTIMGFSGIITIWRGFDYIANRKLFAETKLAKIFCGYSFFVYLFHEPVFNIIKKIPIRLLGATEPVIILMFLINPFIMYVFSIIVAKILQHFVPKVYSILIGGRG